MENRKWLFSMNNEHYKLKTKTKMEITIKMRCACFSWLYRFFFFLFWFLLISIFQRNHFAHNKPKHINVVHQLVVLSQSILHHTAMARHYKLTTIERHEEKNSSILPFFCAWKFDIYSNYFSVGIITTHHHMTTILWRQRTPELCVYFACTICA